MSWKPSNVASPELTRKFRSVAPSNTGSGLLYPCALTLKDGRKLERVACIEEAHGLYAKAWIPLEDIENVEQSPFRLPVAIANEIYHSGESGMGYCLFPLQLSDGESIVCATGSG